MTLLHQAAQKAVEALRQVTTSETFFRDPRGDLAGPAIDALESALQQQEVPREPVSDAAIFAIAGSLGWCRLIDEEYRRSMDLPAGSRWSNTMTADDVLLFARALLAASPSTTQQQEAGNGWRCFHCEEMFTDEAAARLHFGPSIHSDPACHIDAARLRELEAELARYREEDTDLHRHIYGMQSAHQVELRREEEKGYVRGLRDAALHPEDAMLAAAPSTPEKAGGVSDSSLKENDRG